MNRSLGVILIVIGAIMLIWTGINYTKKEKVVDLGPLQVSVDKKETLTWPPYLGAIFLIGGIVIFVSGKKSR